MAGKKLRVGFVGTGGIASGAHFPAWEALTDRTEVVAVCDISEKTANAAADKWGLPKKAVFADYEEMLAKSDLDIVDVCTPNVYHKGPVVAGLNAGCHVIVEKPVAVSAAEVEEMIAARNRSKKLLMVAQSMRFSAEAIAAKKFVDDGGCGPIYWAKAEYLRNRGVPAWGTFIDADMSAGGPCYDLQVHVLDLCLHLMGFPEPVSVSANYWLEIADKPSVMAHDPKKYTVPEDLAAGFVRFKNGACISMSASWALNCPDTIHNVSVFGPKGGVNMAPFTLTREEDGMFTVTQPKVVPRAGIKSHSEEIRQFVEAIQTGNASPVPPEQAIITQKILDAIYESGDKGREIKIK